MASTQNGFSPQLMQEAAAGSALMNAMATKTNIVKIPGTAEGTNARFPAQLSTSEPDDNQWALQRQLVGKTGVVEGIGLSVAGPDYFNYAKRKMDDQQEAAFKQWVMQQANLSTPAEAKWWFEKVPWMKSSREEVINYVSELQKKSALIALNGPQSEEDFRFIFLKENSMINVPTTPVHLLNTGEEYKEVSYQQGFFSPFSQSILKGAIPPAMSLPYKNRKFDWDNPLKDLVGTATEGSGLQWRRAGNPFDAPPAGGGG